MQSADTNPTAPSSNNNFVRTEPTSADLQFRCELSIPRSARASATEIISPLAAPARDIPRALGRLSRQRAFVPAVCSVKSPHRLFPAGIHLHRNPKIRFGGRKSKLRRHHSNHLIICALDRHPSADRFADRCRIIAATAHGSTPLPGSAMAVSSPC